MTLSVAASPRQLMFARWGVFGIFGVHGLVVATWASRIPVIQSALGLKAGQLGLLLLASAIGAILAMPASGWLMGKLGSRRVVLIFSVAFSLLLPTLAAAPTPAWLAVALFFYGFSAGCMDVAMNAQAVLLEKAYARQIMVAFHALFSLGGMLGAGLGGLAAAQGVAPLPHFLIASVLFALLTVVAGTGLLPEPPANQATRSPLFARFTWPLAGLCVIGFCCFLSEGAMIDWSGVFLYRMLHSGEALAPQGYALFSVAMAGGRLIGDPLAERFGAFRLVAGGGLLAALGMLLALWGGLLWGNAIPLALIGFSLVGIGFAVMVPLVCSEAGKIDGNAGLTTVSLFSYGAFLLGPTLIGFLADAWGLRTALMLLVLLSLLAAFSARAGFARPAKV